MAGAGKKEPSTPRCARCGAALSKVARYCTQCGQATPEHIEKQLSAHKKDLHESRRIVKAIAVIFAGVVITIVLPFFLLFMGVEIGFWTTSPLIQDLLIIVVGFFGIALIGRGAFRASLARWPEGIELALGIAAGVLSFALSRLYVLVLLALGAEEGEVPYEGTPMVLVIVMIVVMPMLVEEWVCRGILWHACRRITGVRTTILVTAILFAFLHIPVAGGVLGVPNRFIFGLIWGWLRARSNSLVPSMAAHGLNNLLFILVVM